VSYEFPDPLPVYGGEDLDALSALMGGQVDLALLLPTYFYRPMDDLTPRPGAQALGQGGAFISEAEGVLALGWNPAGMASLREGSLAVDGIVTSCTSTTENLPDTLLVKGLPGFKIDNYDDSLGGFSGFGFLGVAAPLFDVGARPLVGGLAYRRHTDVSYGAEMLLEMGLVEGTGYPFVVASDNNERGSIESLTMGLAYEVFHSDDLSLSLGGSANFLRGRLRSDTQIKAQAQGWDEGFIHFQRDYKGFSLEFGLEAEVCELMRLGGWVGLPHSLEVHNSKFEYRPVPPPNAEYVVEVKGLVAPYDMEIPLFASGGISVGPVMGMQLSADVNHRPWSAADIKHHDEAYSVFDGPYHAGDVTSYHVGACFEFPFFRKPIHGSGMSLFAQFGFRTLPLSMIDLDLVHGEAPYYLGDQVKGGAWGFGFSLETQARVSFHMGLEFQSYDYYKWFMEESSDPRPEAEQRELTFQDWWDSATLVARSVTVFRFSSEMRL
ncbi:MAG: hypothetical protein KAY24_00545, partial [Candidatus Eisenbacteria sp.]|nr:hypothetical protein [Candidatus Eisenbacteria bacterium]